ncbi:phage antirepressor KilAC domain-containing protein [Romboutsia lituseburensis]|uniref:BRO family, N-terminal domain n=2 Tax=Romboutsia lituseburensis TaxID=1537 RepID=A0A1G9MM24_9FIRM|nr:phage antirepressor KilAC domain-containing protein [Romboutsia lituseburensis]SDL75184.1 BRO family, N-terminal domain [Romboutsia lituseburensis DSM 797]
MNHLGLFTNENFGEINVVLINKKEYFEAIPIAKALGYSNPRDAILRLCKKEGVVFSDVGVITATKCDKSQAIQYVSKKFIDEGNVYRLILKSKLPSAKKFESWLMDEVIPSIRKNGMYMNDEAIEQTLNNPDFIIQMANKLKSEKEERLKAEKRASNLESAIKIDKPYTEFGKSIVNSTGCLTIGKFAKLLNNNNIKIGRNQLYGYLRDNGYLIKTGKDKNIPKQIYIKQGLFEVSESIVNTSEGKFLSATTLITGKGQKYFSESLEMIF